LRPNRQNYSKPRGKDGGKDESRESKIHAQESIPLPRRGKPENCSIAREECGGNGQPRGLSPADLTLARLEATVRLVDDIDAALAAHDAIVAVTAA
jgi:hypothetical protein